MPWICDSATRINALALSSVSSVPLCPLRSAAQPLRSRRRRRGRFRAPARVSRRSLPPPPPAAPARRAERPAPGQPEAAPTEATLGVPIYPGAQFIASYDAGRGQRYYIFGSAASFVDLVTFYRTMLKQKGELVYDVPATHEFDVGKYREETMAFPPGVTIKDYLSDVSQGYPNPKPGGAAGAISDPHPDRAGDRTLRCR